MVKRATWLSITPEPERELPRAVATMACAGLPSQDAVAREQATIERLVLHGSERQWLAYLHTVVELIDRCRAVADQSPIVAGARDRAVAVISNHHNLLLALPGRAAAMTATDRARLADQSTE
jgi:hypothetical protein